MMENCSDQLDLLPGFRFHPTDEELITHYLSKKVVDSDFSAIAVVDVDLNKVEPWDLPWKAKMGQKEWYFFCVRDKKYPTGLRTNRATTAGYWKATGKDKEIFRGKSLVGMKKTLVFYKGRAPKGEKTNWVMHEYRLEGNFYVQNLPKTAKSEWVICRVFQKGTGGRKIPITSLIRLNSIENELDPVLPPLIDPHPYDSRPKPAMSDTLDVSCFSNPVEPNSNSLFGCSSSVFPNPFYSTQSGSVQGNLQYHPDSFSIHDHGILRNLFGGYNWNAKQSLKTENDIVNISRGTENSSFASNVRYCEASVEPMNLDGFWN